MLMKTKNNTDTFLNARPSYKHIYLSNLCISLLIFNKFLILKVYRDIAFITRSI